MSICRRVAPYAAALAGLCAALAAHADSLPQGSGVVAGGLPDLAHKQSGVVAIPTTIGLITPGGYAANGTVTDAAIMGGVMDVTIVETRGPDAAAMAGFSADPLATWSDRRAAVLQSQNADAGPLTLNVSAAMLESTDRNIDPQNPGWVFGNRNSAYGTAAELGMLDGRLTLRNEFAWSRPGGEAQADAASARRHRLDARLYNDGTTYVSGYGIWSRTAPDFQALRGDVPANRETVEGGAIFGWGPLTLVLSQTSFTDNLDRMAGVQTQADTTNVAELTLAVNEILPAPRLTDVLPLPLPLPTLLPGTMTLRREAGYAIGLPDASSGSFAEGDVTDRKRDHTALTLGWDWQAPTHTTLALARTTLDDKRPGHESEDSVDRTMMLTQSFMQEGWNASVSFLLGNLDTLTWGDRSRTDRQEMTATLATALDDWPVLSASVIMRRSHLVGIDIANRDVDTGWEAVAAADLTSLLLAGEASDAARLAVMLGAKGSDPDPEDAGARRIDLRGGVQAAINF